MTRSFEEWEAEALSVQRQFDDRITRLGNEVRENWPVWKGQQKIFKRWTEAMTYTLGIGPEALRLRNYRRGSSASRHDIKEGES